MVEALGFAIVRESCNFLMQVVVWAAIFIVVFSSWWMALFSLQGIPRHPDMGQGGKSVGCWSVCAFSVRVFLTSRVSAKW